MRSRWNTWFVLSLSYLYSSRSFSKDLLDHFLFIQASCHFFYAKRLYANSQLSESFAKQYTHSLRQVLRLTYLAHNTTQRHAKEEDDDEKRKHLPYLPRTIVLRSVIDSMNWLNLSREAYEVARRSLNVTGWPHPFCRPSHVFPTILNYSIAVNFSSLSLSSAPSSSSSLSSPSSSSNWYFFPADPFRYITARLEPKLSHICQEFLAFMKLDEKQKGESSTTRSPPATDSSLT
jgi:hypothetical protein